MRNCYNKMLFKLPGDCYMLIRLGVTVEASQIHTARSNIHTDHVTQTAFTSVIKEWAGPVHATKYLLVT